MALKRIDRDAKCGSCFALRQSESRCSRCLGTTGGSSGLDLFALCSRPLLRLGALTSIGAAVANPAPPKNCVDKAGLDPGASP